MRKIILTVSLVIAGLTAWQYAGEVSRSVRILVSTPSRVVEYVAENLSDLLLSVANTAAEALVGLLIAFGCSLGLGILCLYYPRLIRLTLPLLLGIQVVPLIVFAPFMVLLFGIGFTSKAALAALIAFFPLFLTLIRGYESIGQSVHDLLDIYNIRPSFRVFRVYLPLALPSIFSGVKVASTLSVLGAVVAEFTGATVGVGKDIFMTTIRIEPELMVVSVLSCAAIGGVFYLVVDAIERFLGSWYL